MMMKNAFLIGALFASCVAATASAEDATADASAIELNNQGVTAAQAGRFEESAALLRAAVRLAPGDHQIAHSLSNVLTEWSWEVSQASDGERALALLTEAVEQAPDNGLAWLRRGDLEYLEHHDFAAAIQAWRHARGKLPAEQERQLTERLTRVERDQAIERGLPTHETEHADIRVQGGRGDDELAQRIGELVEAAYARLSSAFDVAPPHVSVIVYTDATFQRVSPKDWAVGLYDGRLRLRREEAQSSLAPALVAHELAHAFVYDAYGPRIPLWVQEGFAQAQEPERELSAAERALRAEAASRAHWVPLKWVDRRFAQPASRADVNRAYAEAYAAVQFVLARYGMASFKAFLQRLSAGAAVSAAFDESFAPSHWSRIDQGLLE